jgi:benzoyl-CoA-dihydrodiol lyase
MFCTSTEGVRGQRAQDWRLVDEVVKPAEFAAASRGRARRLQAAIGPRRDRHRTCPLAQRDDDAGTTTTTSTWTSIAGAHRDVHGARASNAAAFAISRDIEARRDVVAAADRARARRCDPVDAHQRARSAPGSSRPAATRAVLRRGRDARAACEHWLVRETVGYLRRTLRAPDVSSRTLFALVERGSCFAGHAVELALAARSHLHATAPDDDAAEPRVAVGAELRRLSDGERDLALAAAFYDGADRMAAVERTRDTCCHGGARSARARDQRPGRSRLDDEIRIALEERASMSPDALTGLEANLRFGGRRRWRRASSAARPRGRTGSSPAERGGGKGALKSTARSARRSFDFDRV